MNTKINKSNIKNYNIQNKKLYLYFYLGCIGSRIIITYLLYLYSKNFNSKHYYFIHYIIGLVFFIFSLTTLNIYIFKLRNNKGAFNNKIWWHDFRPLHSIIYLYIAYINYSHNIKNIWIYFLLDVFYSFIIFTIHHSNNIYKSIIY